MKECNKHRQRYGHVSETRCWCAPTEIRVGKSAGSHAKSCVTPHVSKQQKFRRFVLDVTPDTTYVALQHQSGAKSKRSYIFALIDNSCRDPPLNLEKMLVFFRPTVYNDVAADVESFVDSS